MEYNLNKQEQKLLKLNTKAQRAVTREKALKILKKHAKTTAAPQDPTRCHNSLV